MDGNDPGAVIAQFDAYNDEVFEKSGVPGMAVAVVKDDEVIYLRCFGVKNITTMEPVTPDTVFQLASISKSFTSTAIAVLVGDGELSWDDRVANLNPGFQLSDPWISGHVTLRDLLSHRSGLPAYAADELQSLGYNRSEIIDRLSFIPLTGDFRSSYAYSNIGITSAAEAAAKKAGIDWEDIVAERILIPAGMANTSARFSDFENASDRIDTYPMINGTAVPGPLFNDDVNSPAGGVSSTINDMIRYTMLQLNEGSIDGKQVIDSEALRETHKPQNILMSDNASITTYALGWDTIAEDGKVRVEHGGDLTTGVSTYITLWPENDMGLVVLTNGFPGGFVLKKAVTGGWSDLYFTGEVQSDWYNETQAAINAALQPGSSDLNRFEKLPPAPEDAMSSRPLAEYCGSYSQDYYGNLSIIEDDPGLLVYAGRMTEPFRLSPYGGDAFVEEETGTGVYFTAGSGETIDCVNFTMFDLDWADGTFYRVYSFR